MGGFTVSSVVPASGAEVWARVVTPAGVNHELGPWMRMTVPRAWSGSLSVGRLGRSWLLLFGVVPFDYDDLVLVVFEDGHFVEESTMLSMSSWRHERWVSPSGEVTDSVTFVLRPWLRWLDRPLGWVLVRFFRWRHRRLVGWFSSPR